MDKRDDKLDTMVMLKHTAQERLSTSDSSPIHDSGKCPKNFDLVNIDYKVLFENSNDGIIIHKNGKIILVNHAVTEILGYTKEELLNLTLQELIPNTQHYKLKKALQYVKNYGSVCLETEMACENGSVIQIDVSSKLLDNGFVQGTIRDITERKQLERQLKDSEKELRSFFNVVSDMMCVGLLTETRFTKVNPACLTILGRTPEEMCSRPLIEFIHPDDRESTTHTITKQLQGNPVAYFENRYQHKNGSYRLLSWMATPSIDGTVYAVARDITEYKQTEENYHRAQKMEAIGTLAGGIAHDFNNLLMGIHANSALIRMKEGEEYKYNEELSDIEDCAKRASELTRQLLGYARGGKYDVEPVNLNGLINNSLKMFSRTRKDLFIHTNFAQNLRCVEVDKGQIEQVLLNLFVNAGQAMPNGGDLRVYTENSNKDGKRLVKISVLDTGIGMDKNTLTRIFDPFFTTKERGRGTGLGLASVYGIIQNHNGVIDVYSEIGQGTSFNIYLPVVEKEVNEDNIQVKEIVLGTETILLVDDEEYITRANVRLLERIGYIVVPVSEGSQAVKIYKNQKIDLVLLDMIMPGMNGSDTYDALKEFDPNVKVLLMSGYTIDGLASEILKRGCNGFIQKPFDIQIMSVKIREILDQ